MKRATDNSHKTGREIFRNDNETPPLRTVTFYMQKFSLAQISQASKLFETITVAYEDRHRTRDCRSTRLRKAVVPCQNKIILMTFRPEPTPSVDRPKIILFQHETTSIII